MTPSIVGVHQHPRYCDVCGSGQQVAVRLIGPRTPSSPDDAFRLASRVAMVRPCPQCTDGSWLDGAT